MIEKRKYDWRNVAKVHTQRTPIEYRAAIHCTTGTALASLSFGCYSCLLGFLCPLISRRSLLATSWIIWNNFHKFQNFRKFWSNFLICFRKFEWKSDTRHSFLEFVAKSGQNFIKRCKIRHKKWKKWKFIREKMLTSFGWNFEIWAVQKYVNLVDLVKSFPTSIYLQKSASIQPRTSLSKFAKN